MQNFILFCIHSNKFVARYFDFYLFKEISPGMTSYNHNGLNLDIYSMIFPYSVLFHILIAISAVITTCERNATISTMINEA